MLGRCLDYSPAESTPAKAVSLACHVYEAEAAAACCSRRNKTRQGSMGSHEFGVIAALPRGDVPGIAFIEWACARKH